MGHSRSRRETPASWRGNRAKSPHTSRKNERLVRAWCETAVRSDNTNEKGDDASGWLGPCTVSYSPKSFGQKNSVRSEYILPVRFDERGVETEHGGILGHRQTKGPGNTQDHTYTTAPLLD